MWRNWKRVGTSNRSAPGPDGISHQFIKIVPNTKLGREMIREIAVSLKEGGYRRSGSVQRWSLYPSRIKIIRLRRVETDQSHQLPRQASRKSGGRRRGSFIRDSMGGSREGRHWSALARGRTGVVGDGG